MNTHYIIFKTDKVTSKTINICGGCHNTKEECLIHWQSYMYGFMDGAFEMLGRDNFGMMESREHKLGFEFHIPEKKYTVEFFMLLDEEADELMKEICY